MEFLLKPNYGGDSSIAKTPYVGKERYDGGPFMSYPSRVLGEVAESSVYIGNPLDRGRKRNVLPLRETEAFIQTWLHFGLISELLRKSFLNDDVALDISEESVTPKESLDWMYETLIVQDGSGISYVRIDNECLQSLRGRVRTLVANNDVDFKRYSERIFICLSHTRRVLSTLSPDFNHTVNYSISALAEMISYIIVAVCSRRGIPSNFGNKWCVGFLDADAKASMRARGWCPSDIARAEVKYLTIPSLTIIRMMDKSLPQRDHCNCTEFSCCLYQVSNVLRLNGDKESLTAEILEVEEDKPYIAISHVWADGLGNPFANSLFSCKLHRLKQLVAALEPSASSSDADSPLIWLDTLCCPAENGEGKQKAIEKIRLVYQRAKHVLVLDAGLMAYAADSQPLYEQLARIFTASWLRRLWTLQEGSLANSLYFQFKDRAVSLDILRDDFSTRRSLMAEEIFRKDVVIPELWRLQAFFHYKREQQIPMEGEVEIEIMKPSILVLDQALQFRSVSVASDEPLCIGTLMSLDLPKILSVGTQELRMQVVWKLIAEKYGVPAQTIFFEEEKLQGAGFRWALKSLLSIDSYGMDTPDTHILKWNSPQIGIVTSKGLSVRYKGCRLSVRQGEKNMPHDPWPGMFRLPETFVAFRESKTGRWYRMFDKKYVSLMRKWKSDEDREAHNNLNLFPLHKLVDSGSAVVIYSSDKESAKDQATFTTDAVLSILNSQEEGGIYVKAKRQVVFEYLMEEGYVYETVRELAYILKAHELTKKHLALYERLYGPIDDLSNVPKEEFKKSEEFQASLKALKDKMKEMMVELHQTDQRFAAAVQKFTPGWTPDIVWGLLMEWFKHDYDGEDFDGEQVWIVD